MKTQYKIALYLIVANTILLLAFGGSVYYFSSRYSYVDFYKRLETRARIAARYTFDLDSESSETIKNIREEHLERLPNEKEYIFDVTTEEDLSQKAQQQSLPLLFLKTVLSEGKANAQKSGTFYSGVKHVARGATHIVVISAENYYAIQQLVLLRNIILWVLLFVLVINISLSWYFSKHVYDPIKRITSDVKKISSDNIHLRLDESQKDSEINQLILTFNDLLSRLETAFDTQKNFISNASHEFGTPLTTIIGEADVALMKERSSEEYQEALKTILFQAERLNQISQTLLLLAQTGYKQNHTNFEIVRTDELLWQAKEILNKLIPKNDIQIDFSLVPENPFKLKVYGNKQLLTLAFVNILTNACKYSNNKPTFITIASSDEQVILTFRDQGIGIPESELQYIYDPFFRASNTRIYDGFGIGLPLTRNIVRIHNGQLKVSSVLNKGTTVQIKIPLAKIKPPIPVNSTPSV